MVQTQKQQQQHGNIDHHFKRDVSKSEFYSAYYVPPGRRSDPLTQTLTVDDVHRHGTNEHLMLYLTLCSINPGQELPNLSSVHVREPLDEAQKRNEKCQWLQGPPVGCWVRYPDTG